jgi:hypothetical protein
MFFLNPVFEQNILLSGLFRLVNLILKNQVKINQVRII